MKAVTTLWRDRSVEVPLYMDVMGVVITLWRDRTVEIPLYMGGNRGSDHLMEELLNAGCTVHGW